MPCLGLKCEICLATFPLDEVINENAGLDHFEGVHGEKQYLHRDFVYSIALDAHKTNTQPKRNGTSYSASMCGGCHREHALKRTVEYWANPYRWYDRIEGTLLHESLSVPKPWLREVQYEEQPILGGKILISGAADRINPVERIVEDLKSHNCPEWTWKYPTPNDRAAGAKPRKVINEKVYPPGEGEQLQVNVLARLIEANDPGPEYRMQIADMWKGTPDNHRANRLVTVPRWDDDVMLDRLLPNYTLIKTIMSEPSPLKRLTMIAEMELAGREMFNARDGTCKCDKYCDVRDACDSLLPKVEGGIDLTL